MTTEQKLGITSLVLALSIVLVALTTLNLGIDYGYKRGQTDALNGIWKYEMMTDTVTTVVEK
jgi:hypothetical protein